MREPWLELSTFQTFNERSAASYEAALAQLEVDKTERYLPWSNDTYCNIFVWDGTRALGCEIPHWVDAAGNRVKPFSTKLELSANGVGAWLTQHGGRHGWVTESLPIARQRAVVGHPVVLQWTNPTMNIQTGRPNPGHVAFLMPDGMVLQAGKTNGRMTIERAFGSRLFTCWTHD